MKTYIIGPFLAFLPERWRKARFGHWNVHWARAATLSGLFEGVVALLALVIWYSVFVVRISEIIGGRGGDFEGYVGLFSLAMHPLTWVICYFGCEGAVRFLAGLVSEESYGTLPLWLISRTVQKMKAGLAETGKRSLMKWFSGGDGCDLQIRSCRAKDHWKYPLTIRYRNEFFQVMGEEQKPPAELRPYAYFLRRLPANEIIRGLEPYDPTNVLAEEPQGLFETVFGEIRRQPALKTFLKTRDRS